ncbi:hypothetical protein B484DRAFT_433773 [Ochromonadaceae sp. CCMP2298]|nr:hypothetical protein B484DRAFT_433773 [Ochromonadaceae sp. CCMP2298]
MGLGALPPPAPNAVAPSDGMTDMDTDSHLRQNSITDRATEAAKYDKALQARSAQQNWRNLLHAATPGSAASSRVTAGRGAGNEATGALGIGVPRLGVGQVHGQFVVPEGDPRLRQQQTTMRSAVSAAGPGSAAIGGVTAEPLQGILRRSDGSSGSGQGKKVSFRDVNGGTNDDVQEIPSNGED